MYYDRCCKKICLEPQQIVTQVVLLGQKLSVPALRFQIELIAIFAAKTCHLTFQVPFHQSTSLNPINIEDDDFCNAAATGSS